MGWGDCGTDSKGRNIGYVWPATCDHEGCDKEIDRGLSYACEGMHGHVQWGCDEYFCGDHLNFVEDSEGECFSICDNCLSKLEVDENEVIVDFKNS